MFLLSSLLFRSRICAKARNISFSAACCNSSIGRHADKMASEPKPMPLIGLGTSKDNPELIGLAVKSALKVGYRLVDTATFYRNEAEIGNALKESFESGVVTRDEVYVITKVPPTGSRRVSHYLKLSLKKLQLDYVDLYLIHMPVPILYGKDDDDLMPRGADGKVMYDMDTHHLDIWKSMEACVDEGLCRAIGLSNFNAEQVEDIWNHARIKPSNLQAECHLHLQEEELVQKCQQLGVTVTAFAPLGSPDYGRFLKEQYNAKDEGDFTSVLEEPLLKQLGKIYNKTPAQVALRWLIQRGINPIPKSVKEERIKENFQVFDFTLTEEEMNLLKKANKNIRNFDFKMFAPGIESHPFYPY